MNLLQWGIACGMTGCLLAAASAAELIWKNDEYRIYPKKNRCVVRKMSGEPSGLEVLFRPTQSRPGVEAPFMVVAIVQKDSRFSDRMASYGAFAVDVENCNDRPLVFQVRIVTHHGKVERATENFRQIIPARSKVTVTAPYATVAPFSRIALDPRLRLSPAGVDCNVNLFRERLSVDFGVLSASLYQEKEYKFKLTNFRLTGQPPQYTPLLAHPEKFFPFIDDFGQYIHADWPEKVHSEADLKGRAVEERKALAAMTPIPRRTRFGGWADGPTLRATGFFRVDRYRDRWTLVDPEGKLFFGMGMNGIRFRQNDYKKDRRHWFTHLEDHTSRNLKIKYGSIDPAAVDMAQERLCKWGFNTVGGWCDKRVYRGGRLAYTPVLLDWSKPALIPGRKFYDAFDPAFVRSLDDAFKTQWKFTIDDPWCIGYFIHNELTLNPVELGEHVATAPAAMPGKKEFRKFLEKKYPSIRELNPVWSADYADYDDFMSSRKIRFDKRKSHSDMAAFGRVMIDRYYRVCRDAVRRNAPNHLYLGSRLRPLPDADLLVAYIANQYCDVVSINSYYLLYRDLGMPGITKPIWLSEYSIRADGRGYWGAQPYRDQQERAEVFQQVFRDILANPALVGASWFCYRSQLVTGRDARGEAYPFGFVDITDTPYPEMTQANRRLSETMYDIRFGAGK